LEHLRGKKVALIGLGSGGGFVATGLAMSAVANFVLIDDDVLEAHNVVRHVGDLRDVGRPKAELVADLILARNAEASVQVIVSRVEDHTAALDGIDLVICAADGEGTKYLINDLCRARGLTAIYAGVYERGEGGDVVTIQPDEGPCYACWAANLRQGQLSPSPDGSGELDYGLLNEQGTLDAEPGLWLHVARVAGVQADVSLNELLRGTPAYRVLPGNTVVLANSALEIIEGKVTPPHSAEWINIKRNPACLVCGGSAHHAQESIALDTLAGDMLRFEESDEAQRLRGESHD
jgi:molybdopterin/thiamine biosynthesis adenylyltransferase